MSTPSSSVASAQQRILASLSLSGEEAVPFASLQRDLALDQRLAADALRGLMETGKVVLRRSTNANGSNSVYVALANSMPEGPSLVLDAIRASGNSGIDQPTLCSKIRLPKTEIIKALQMLVAQKRIKERRCLSNRAKRIYLLFEFEPSDEVTGGSFYGGGDSREMDVWFVDEMRRRAVALVAQLHSVSLEQITQHLQESHGNSGMGDIPSSASTGHLNTNHPNTNINNTAAAAGGGGGGGGAVVITALPNGSTITSASGSKSCNKRISQRDAQILVQTLVLDGILDCVSPSPGAPGEYQLATGRNVLRHFTATTAGVGSRTSTGATAATTTGTTTTAASTTTAGMGTRIMDDGRDAHMDFISNGIWSPAPVSQASAWAMPAVGLPCLGCAQLPVCSANGIGVLNPRNCAYLNEWLS
ncbi:uncharacterized protein TM35_000092470 [Trypanosoma theileri]|uniref:DNA-directed RNA polymerase III subunit RPC6 n=1 Tax=Trypanosoma theileri TaxID=67003 RepID=A0A1X0NZS8_9TRYP|nr:uncharacterized protein TM35_000092470 [Trypanosoma theileri]ORC90197.1 hypothetical protein TM35_000092470 [Trypanosoma theileri]